MHQGFSIYNTICGYPKSLIILVLLSFSFLIRVLYEISVYLLLKLSFRNFRFFFRNGTFFGPCSYAYIMPTCFQLTYILAPWHLAYAMLPASNHFGSMLSSLCHTSYFKSLWLDDILLMSCFMLEITLLYDILLMPCFLLQVTLAPWHLIYDMLLALNYFAPACFLRACFFFSWQH